MPLEVKPSSQEKYAEWGKAVSRVILLVVCLHNYCLFNPLAYTTMAIIAV